MTIEKPAPHQQSAKADVDAILKAAWETAARKNPMLLVKQADADFGLLRQIVREYLEKGLSPAEVGEHISNTLLGLHREIEALPVEAQPSRVSFRNTLNSH